jgi:hypothetical protein
VAAESLGLGTVYIGGMRNDPQRVAETLGLPPRTVAVFGLCVGWPAKDAVAEVKPRLAQRAVLHHELYDDARTRGAEIAAYDRTMRCFYDQHGIGNPEGWTAHSAGRVATTRGLHGRDLLGSILKALGFAQR